MLNLYLFLFLNESCSLTCISEISGTKSGFDIPYNINDFDIACDVKQKKTVHTDRWNSSLFIDSKLGAAQAPGDECASGSACLCAFSLQYICDAGTDREDSFTLALHYKHATIQ